MGAGGVKEDAPASVGREAKGLLRQQGFKSPSCLIGSIIAYNRPLIYQSIEIHTSLINEQEREKSTKCFTYFSPLGAFMLT